MKQLFRFVLVIGLLLILMLSWSSLVAAQEGASENARVRIGYFAFDPRNYDTYIDGELASFNVGWEQDIWGISLPDMPWARCCNATPYMNFARGVHSFAFAPEGKGLDAVILEPQEITFAPGHVYSLALVGDMNMDTLTLLTFDETEAYQGIDPEANFMGIMVHSLAGGPPIDIVIGDTMIADNLEYGQSVVAAWPDEFPYFATSTSGDQPITLFELTPSFTVPRMSDLTVITGSFPGEPGKDIFWDFNWYWPGEITVVDSGEVTLDSQTAGEVGSVKERVAYTLALDTDTILNMYVRATGERTEGSLYEGMFDAAMYLYDEQGNLLFWNDEESAEDNPIGDSALKNVSLKAGVYRVQVGGYADLNGGPYELTIEKAAAS